MELHQRRHVGKTDVVCARCHTGHRAARAVPGVNRDVQLGVLEIAFRGGRQEQGGRAFKSPVQLKLDGRNLRVGDAHGGGQGQGGSGFEQKTLIHENSVWMDRGVTVYTLENQSKKNARGSFPKAGLLKKVYNFCVQIMRVYPSRDHRGKP